MISNKFWAAMGKALAAATVTLIVALMLASGAWAQSKYKSLYKFKGGADGWGPGAGVIFDATGNIYGTTGSGGAYGYGTVFQLSPSRNGGWKEHVLHSFIPGGDGVHPAAGLIFDSSGNLYSTTGGGGVHNDSGTVFELTPKDDGSWEERILHSFDWQVDGCYPSTGVLLDSAGNLYGMVDCGQFGVGSVFELVPNPDGSWTEKTIYSFTGGHDGSFPSVGLIFDAPGNLYGATSQGGDFYDGVVFELSPNPDGSWTENVLHSFKWDGNDGIWPVAVVLDSAGNLYGTTVRGGTQDSGTVFELTPNLDGTWSETVLHSFKGGKDGAGPSANLILDAFGNLYGTTTSGGAYGYGVVFKLTRSADGKWREKVLHAFKDHPGAYPSGSLIFNAAGNLYGTTAGDGVKTFGSVFQITP